MVRDVDDEMGRGMEDGRRCTRMWGERRVVILLMLLFSLKLDRNWSKGLIDDCAIPVGEAIVVKENGKWMIVVCWRKEGVCLFV